MARDELHVVLDELRIKAMTVSRVNQEASEAVSSMERLTEECHGFTEIFRGGRPWLIRRRGDFRAER